LLRYNIISIPISAKPSTTRTGRPEVFYHKNTERVNVVIKQMLL